MNIKTVELYSQDGQRIIVNESDVAYFSGKGFGEKLKEPEAPIDPPEDNTTTLPADANQSNVDNAEPEQPSEPAKTKKPKQTGAV